MTTLDLRLQELAEKALEAKAKRGAIVIIEPNSGDILAMASWPTYNPNSFIPNISAGEVQGAPGRSEHPACFRARFVRRIRPAQSLRSRWEWRRWRAGRSGASDEFDCPPAIQVGNVIFHNWKKVERGSLNFVQAFTESCDTWFYQAGIKMGAEPIIEWALKMGFGAKCGIPLRGRSGRPRA